MAKLKVLAQKFSKVVPVEKGSLSVTVWEDKTAMVCLAQGEDIAAAYADVAELDSIIAALTKARAKLVEVQNA